MQSNNKEITHLSQEEREKISKMLVLWKSYRAIWRELGRPHSTISKEIERNAIYLWFDKYEYSPWKAEERTKERREKANKRHCKLIKDEHLRKVIIWLMERHWEYIWPDEIIHRLEMEIKEKLIWTSTIYRYFRWYGKRNEKYLRYKWFGYRERWKKWSWWKYKDIAYIEEREYENENRLEVWHWECDTIVNPKGIKWWLVTLVDRKSRYILMMKVKDLKWETIYWSMKYLLYGKEVKSLTIDNWVEFSEIREFKKEWIKIYRCHAYSSWQKWSNERNNWLVRKKIPKKCNINDYSDEEIREIMNRLNNKPRKILGYKSAYEIYYNQDLKYFS